MSMLFDLSGKVALLTGASKGIGLAMATALAQYGATVVISARTQEQLDIAAEEINTACGTRRAFGVAANAGNKKSLRKFGANYAQLCGTYRYCGWKRWGKPLLRTHVKNK
jgi:NAD(P)-dependent dehydrogenase (short-subunit alcohol dehydrogenase family)